MKNISSLFSGIIGKSFLIALLGSLMFVFPASANELQCDLIRQSKVKGSIIEAMLEAANKGYLYRVDSSSSNVAFEVSHFPFSTVEGSFHVFDGGLTMPIEKEESRQAVFLIKVDSMDTGDGELNDYLKSNVFFNATEFPNIVFVSTGFEWINETTARLYGELTLRGTTKPLMFEMHISKTENYLDDNGQVMVISAYAEIQRSEFGMHELSLLVSDTVRFNLTLEATRVRI